LTSSTRFATALQAWGSTPTTFVTRRRTRARAAVALAYGTEFQRLLNMRRQNRSDDTRATGCAALNLVAPPPLGVNRARQLSGGIPDYEMFAHEDKPTPAAAQGSVRTPSA
jgi:hypothetical protein